MDYIEIGYWHVWHTKDVGVEHITVVLYEVHPDGTKVQLEKYSG